MVNYDATISRGKETTDLIFKLDESELTISLTDDNPNQVKEVFNRLIIHLKQNKIEFELKDDEGDLFTNISKEYIRHLNSEMANIYGELKANNLLDSSKTT